MIAKIAVSAAVYAIDKPYDYLVPESLEESCRPGVRVTAPFGRGNRTTEGIVLATAPGRGDALKPISAVLDDQPVMDEGMLRLAAFVRERYFCTYYDAARAMLPAGLWFTAKQTYTIVDTAGDWRELTRRQPEAASVMESIAALGGRAELSDLKKQFSEETLNKALHCLLGKKLLTADTDLLRRVGDKTEQVASLAVPAEEAMAYAARKRKSAPLQYAVLELLSTIGSGCVKEIAYFTGASTATFKRLETLGYLELSEQETLRRPTITVDEPAAEIVLNEEQQAAFDGLLEQSRQSAPGTALLYGVTGSGKTMVYLRLIQNCLDEGKSALLLVPEIALTPQLLSRFAAHFGDQVAVLHSSLRVGERYDEWKRIRSGAARVVIGTRSAVFAPLVNPGLFILDEEQEHTYKSENAPRYHAREVAIYRGTREKALVVLGSATPSIESMYRARTGVYGFYQIRGRYNGRDLPEVSITDLKQELRAGNGTSIGSALRVGIERNLEEGRQTILLLNRRGASRMVVCVDCGQVPQCPRCSVSLTYHSANGRLMCHYCGHSEPLPQRCPTCGGHIKQVGTGTQRAEQELYDLFPNIRVLRMDADTISAANPHEKILSEFRQKKADVLIGTQMVAKGLDFPNVTLVGVLDADSSLYVDHYRASETTFSMLTQVVGRAGRGETAGRAVVQTMTPENAVISLAAAQDYDGFYETEIAVRDLRDCPPFSDLFTITFAGLTESHVAEGALRYRTMLVRQLQSPPYDKIAMQVLGPAPAPVAKINNTYRYRLTLSCRNSRPVRDLISGLLRQFAQDKTNKGVSAFADVNSYE
jgi:primosomal protein N' (replication factor Y)